MTLAVLGNNVTKCVVGCHHCALTVLQHFVLVEMNINKHLDERRNKKGEEEADEKKLNMIGGNGQSGRECRREIRRGINTGNGNGR